MIRFVLIFVSGLIQILGRPFNELNPDGNNFLEWPSEKNMFLLPRILNVNEKINITVHAKNTTRMIEITLVAVNKSSVNDICSFNVDIKRQIARVTHNDTKTGKLQTVEMEMEHFLMSDIGDREFSVTVQRRANRQKRGANNVLQLGSDTSQLVVFETDFLNDMRYLKFSGDNARVSRIEFEFN